MAKLVLRFKKTIMLSIIFLAMVCLVLMLFVNINYDLTEYLPKDVPSSIALDKVKETFDDEIPNLSVYVKDVSVAEALEIKGKIEGVEGVESVLWLDDITDLNQPLAFMDKKEQEAWYKDKGALYLVAADSEISERVVEGVRETVNKEMTMSGSVLNQATMQSLTSNEVSKIIFFVVPLVLIILLLSTSSFIEPLLFLLTIGIAILLNEGTNYFVGEISYVTRSTSAVLQLAVSMDYAIFLLHSFSRHRAEKNNIEGAMLSAMREAAPAVAASATTTVFGFLALTLMEFRLGPNLGWVLAKGILFSFLSVMLLLPILTVYTTKLMDKTHHRNFIPPFTKFSRFVMRVCIPLSIVFFLLIAPSYFAQSENQFIYGSSGIHAEGSQLDLDAKEIGEVFGEKQQMVIIIPGGDMGKEALLSDNLKALPNIDTVISYSGTVGVTIPQGFLEKEQKEQFIKKGKTRIILYADADDEGDESFALVESIRETVEKQYGDDYYLLGQNVINYDLKDTIVKDGPRVSGAAIIAIGMVLLITFRSFSIPFILLLTIEGAVWINLGIPYFLGKSLNYVGFLIISSVQLGATVDYGILLASHYMRFRKTLEKKEAMRRTLEISAVSILTPASILAIATLILGIISTNGIISELGLMLGRGALISAGMVLMFLPALLLIFDKAIEKTTYKSNFLKRQEGERL